MNVLRGVITALSKNGKDKVTNACIFEAFGLQSEQEKAQCRSRIAGLVRLHELKRIEPGIYSHSPKSMKLDGVSFVKMWRATRIQTKSFQMSYIASISHYNVSTVSKYLKFLLVEGFIRRNGKKGVNKLFYVTPKGREQRETPYPPKPIKDPFAKERAAISRLARIFFERDLYQPTAQEKIVKECKTILDRFEKSLTKEN